MKKTLLLLCAGLAAISPAQSQVLKIELPVETATYKPGPGSDLANAQCLSCHSVEYVTLQPSLPRSFWKDSVNKMITVYGAPIPTEQIDELVDYLAKAYGSESVATPGAGNIAAVQPAPPAKPNSDAKSLAIRNGCFNCHQPSAKTIGPSYKDVAAKYKDDPEALAKVSSQITSGGSGKWGVIPMPPFKQLSESDVRLLSEWVLNH